MSQELTKEQKLTALVLSTTANDYPYYCALSRAYDAALTSGMTFKQTLPDAFAMDYLGFSLNEARGIMNGWDTARGTFGGYFAEEECDADAVKLGTRLYHMVVGSKE